MKKPIEIKELNYNDIAFFTGKTITEIKWEMSTHLYTTKNIDENLDKRGNPKVSLTDLVNKSLFETEIRSCSDLEGLNYIDHVVSSYNKGIDLTRLRSYAEKDTFIKALRFTGKFNIINEILNEKQYKLLQEKWLFANTYSKKAWTDNCFKFIISNKWSIGYLESHGFSKSFVDKKVLSYLNK
tara:strand:+ start:1236 stop:1784 length:549 start_codon:yes stop_codon:yes gene_type:complete